MRPALTYVQQPLPQTDRRSDSREPCFPCRSIRCNWDLQAAPIQVAEVADLPDRGRRAGRALADSRVLPSKGRLTGSLHGACTYVPSCHHSEEPSVAALVASASENRVSNRVSSL